MSAFQALDAAAGVEVQVYGEDLVISVTCEPLTEVIDILKFPECSRVIGPVRSLDATKVTEATMIGYCDFSVENAGAHRRDVFAEKSSVGAVSPDQPEPGLAADRILHVAIHVRREAHLGIGIEPLAQRDRCA